MRQVHQRSIWTVKSLDLMCYMRQIEEAGVAYSVKEEAKQ